MPAAWRWSDEQHVPLREGCIRLPTSRLPRIEPTFEAIAVFRNRSFSMKEPGMRNC
jgi:hypothetical protein